MDRSSATERQPERIRLGRAMAMLAVGALAGGGAALCGRWLPGLPLLNTVLQSAFSAMLLGCVVAAGAGDLAVEMGQPRI